MKKYIQQLIPVQDENLYAVFVDGNKFIKDKVWYRALCTEDDGKETPMQYIKHLTEHDIKEMFGFESCSEDLENFVGIGRAMGQEVLWETEYHGKKITGYLGLDMIS